METWAPTERLGCMMRVEQLEMQLKRLRIEKENWQLYAAELEGDLEAIRNMPRMEGQRMVVA